jgi:hypothetical protein
MPNWRDDLPVHPAADLFPIMSESELRELGEDIKANGLQFPVIVHDDQLLDGRNRLDAMTLVGVEFKIKQRREVWVMESKGVDVPYITGAITCSCEIHDPYAYVVSANLHRRHLTAEQSRELIEKLLKAKPEASDRAIAKQTKRDHKTVGKARAELEGRGEIPHVKKRTDSKGRGQPSTKPKKATAKLADGSKVDVGDLGPKARAAIAAQAAEVDPEVRRAEMAKLAERDLPPEERAVEISAEALRDFKTACNTYLPRLNKADAAQARVFFNEWTAKAVKAEAKAAKLAGATA